jgi:hypothetical protein
MTGWMRTEAGLIDALRRIGATLRESGGVHYLVAEFFDGDSGQLLDTQFVLNIEKLARALDAPDKE